MVKYLIMQSSSVKPHNVSSVEYTPTYTVYPTMGYTLKQNPIIGYTLIHYPTMGGISLHIFGT